MEEQRGLPKESGEDTSILKFDYIKSNLHRVVHADGVVGGPTPHGNLSVSFWNERAPIPQQVAHEITPRGGKDDPQSASMGAERKDLRISRDAIVREVETTIIIDYRHAVALRDWLDRHLVKLKEIERDRRSEAIE